MNTMTNSITAYRKHRKFFATDALTQFINASENLVVLTGAGCSAHSGIPTYRDSRGHWQRSAPIYHQEFISKPSSRQRYWARSVIGWPNVANAVPNAAHYALAAIENVGKIGLLVTQNIDSLHQRAGHKNVVDLHGRLDRVVCLGCGAASSRHALQERLLIANPQLPKSGDFAPDGDADIQIDVTTIDVPSCTECEGILKPDVVFFGDNVKPKIVQSIYQSLSNSDGLLVVGSSLKVYSGFRFCKKAAELGKPIVCVNPGVTRGDSLYKLKVKADCVKVFSNLIEPLELK